MLLASLFDFGQLMLLLHLGFLGEEIWPWILKRLHQGSFTRNFRCFRSSTGLQNIVFISLITHFPMRLNLIVPLESQITKVTGVVLETAWVEAAFYLLLCMLASHKFETPLPLFSFSFHLCLIILALQILNPIISYGCASCETALEIKYLTTHLFMFIISSTTILRIHIIYCCLQNLQMLVFADLKGQTVIIHFWPSGLWMTLFFEFGFYADALTFGVGSPSLRKLLLFALVGFEEFEASC
ncbi:hypothetical protein SADUNF_Sadunf06G0104000 [Salix dunnii]|uniref:Uncharacterized protein n=1 Tax=Salix dunnii TaxID=1413687 RepID=A0A835MVC3_9ROSI|nr:hypothetical protein SADUNF_Sadunf06G0104000 [Salix dunnii]